MSPNRASLGALGKDSSHVLVRSTPSVHLEGSGNLELVTRHCGHFLQKHGGKSCVSSLWEAALLSNSVFPFLAVQ